MCHWTGSSGGSGNGLTPVQRQVITWTNADLLWIPVQVKVSHNTYVTHSLQPISWIPKNKMHWHLNSNIKIFSHKYVFQSGICKIALLSRLQCVHPTMKSNNKLKWCLCLLWLEIFCLWYLPLSCYLKPMFRYLKLQYMWISCSLSAFSVTLCFSFGTTYWAINSCSVDYLGRHDSPVYHNISIHSSHNTYRKAKNCIVIRIASYIIVYSYRNLDDTILHFTY